MLRKRAAGLGTSVAGQPRAAGAASAHDERRIDARIPMVAADRERDGPDLGRGDVDDLRARNADQVVVLVEGGFVPRGAAEGEDLDQADPAQDVERTVDRPQADRRKLGPHPLVDRLGGQVRAVLERVENRGALLGEAVTRLEESCIDSFGIGRRSGPPLSRSGLLPYGGPDERNVV